MQNGAKELINGMDNELLLNIEMTLFIVWVVDAD